MLVCILNLLINTFRKGQKVENVSPVFGLQAVQSVVVSVVEASLHHPVDERLGKKPHEDVVESADMNHVQGKAVTGHPAQHPGALARAEKGLKKHGMRTDGLYSVGYNTS